MNSIAGETVDQSNESSVSVSKNKLIITGVVVVGVAAVAFATGAHVYRDHTEKTRVTVFIEDGETLIAAAARAEQVAGIPFNETIVGIDAQNKESNEAHRVYQARPGDALTVIFNQNDSVMDTEINRTR
jgi:hypothetical protein